MRNENGISLMNICIIVAIIFIVATICAFIFNESYEKKELNIYISQMELIQEKVNWVRSEYKIWDEYDPNETGNFYTYLQELGYSNANNLNNPYIKEFNEIIKSLDKKNLKSWNSNVDIVLANYCYFSPEDLNKYFELDNIDLNVIINFYTGNVISKEGIKNEDEIIYRQYDSQMGNKLVVPQIYNYDAKPRIEIIENFGLSQRVKISFEEKNEVEIMEIYYYLSPTDENKKMCSNLNGYYYNKEENAVYFNIETSGEYSFIIEDTNFVQYQKIEQQFNLCNPPEMIDGMIGIYWEENGAETRIISESDANWYDYSKKEFRMANAKTEDGNYWVWIPRFLSKKTTEGTDIEFVKGNSNIATNNKAMTGYEINKAFSEDGEIKGFWMAKFQANNEKNELNFKPGKALSIFTLQEAQNEYRKIKNISKDYYYTVMSDNNLNAVFTISEAIESTVSNNLVHYAGGSPKEEDFKENVKYSSTNNIYGVYDLLTSENELTINSNPFEEGRFRLILKSK